MNTRSRATRFALALALASAFTVATSRNGGTAVAQDSYGGGGNSDTVRNVVVGATVGFVGYTLIKGAAVESRALEAAAAAAGGGEPQTPSRRRGDPTLPLYEVTRLLSDDFSQVAGLIDTAGLTETYRSRGPLTVFWPTDDILSGLPTSVTAALKASPASARAVVQAHTVLGRYRYADLGALPTGKQLATLGGGKVTVGKSGGGVTLDGVALENRDIVASNGWIHPLRGVLAR